MDSFSTQTKLLKHYLDEAIRQHAASCSIAPFQAFAAEWANGMSSERAKHWSSTLMAIYHHLSRYEDERVVRSLASAVREYFSLESKVVVYRAQLTELELLVDNLLRRLGKTHGDLNLEGI